MPAAFYHQIHLVGAYGHFGTKDEYVRLLNSFAEKSRRFGTIDTYARSLFLQNDTAALLELKATLSTYFALNQVLPVQATTGTNYEKADVIDTRYMGWLAVLLDQKNAVNEHVKVLSWNYDLQVEYALMQYAKHERLGDVFSSDDIVVYPGSQSIASKSASTKSQASAQRSKVLGQPNPRRSPFLIHLNGVAGAYPQRDGAWGTLDSGTNWEDQSHKVVAILKVYDEFLQAIPKGGTGLTDTFTFAWEQAPQTKKAMSSATRHVMEADVLVIIGYSFPSFNRIIDRSLVAAFCTPLARTKEKRLVIQNPSLSEQTFRHMFDFQPAQQLKVQIETNLDQFYMPPELFA